MSPRAELDSEFAAARNRLSDLTRGWPDRYGVSFQDARTLLDRERAILEPDPPALAWVENLRVGDMAARLYGGAAAHGLIIYLHGGGGCVGSLDSHDTICRRLALASGRWLLALDYPLAPEHPYPTALRTIQATLRGPLPVPKTAKEARPCLAGDSAGASLVLELALNDRCIATWAEALILLYGNFVYECAAESHRLFGGGAYGLSDHALKRYWAAYFAAPPSTYRHRNLIQRVTDVSLPRTLVLAAGLDPLRDDSVYLAERMAANGQSIRLDHAPALPHGFLSYAASVAAVREVFTEIAAWLNAP